jgi:four helix bundle protein
LVAERAQQPQGFRELEVYQRSYAMVVPMYRLAKSFPDIEKYDLASQVRRAAKSIPTNIGEGYAVRIDSPKSFCRQLRTSYGSAVEMQIHMDIAKDLDYVDEAAYRKYRDEYDAIGKMIYRLWQHWRKKLRPGVHDDE